MGIVKLDNIDLTLMPKLALIVALNKALKARAEPLSWGGPASISTNSSVIASGLA